MEAKAVDLGIKQLPASSADDAIEKLGGWLKHWRSHGRTPQPNTGSPGFKYAKADHDSGLGQGGAPGYRAALGLPIVQFYSTAKKSSNWEASQTRGEGRFASPVILRPHRDAQGGWHALVIFVDAHKWPAGKPVYLNGQARAVSLALYEAMKADAALRPFP